MMACFGSRENATLISRIGIGLMIYALSAEEQGFAEENPMQTRESASSLYTTTYYM
jgi:hypothetical protein